MSSPLKKRAKVAMGMGSADEEVGDPNQNKTESEPILQNELTTCRDGPGSASVEDTVADTDNARVDMNILGEHDLFLIFETASITTKDLLNLRLVSILFRDAATSVLLKRNSVQIRLSPVGAELEKIESIDITRDSESTYANVDTRHGPLRLCNLMKLISSSPNFPCTSLKFFGGGLSLGKHTLGFKEVNQLFALYGSKIKSLSLDNTISTVDFRELLLHQLPNLEHLDLRGLKFVSLMSLRGFKPLFLRRSTSSSGSLALKTIQLGPCFTKATQFFDRSTMAEILRSSPKLESFQWVEGKHLEIILEEKKAHVVKELLYAPFPAYMKFFDHLADARPTLSKLYVDLSFICGVAELYSSVVLALNKLLQSSKETLKCFQIKVNPLDFLRKIRIPSLKKLERLLLIEDRSDVYQNNNYNHEPEFEHFENEDETPIFEFEEGKTEDLSKYFPKLRTILLDVQDYYVEGTLMHFFTYDSVFADKMEGASIDSDSESAGVNETISSVASVERLIIENSTKPSCVEASLMSKIFPALCHLEIKCDGMTGSFENSTWTLFPAVQSIVLYGVVIDNRRAGQVKSQGVDSFFTGFTKALCVKLQDEDGFPEEIERSESLIKFFRVKPSICDLRYLKEFQIKFVKVSSPFASKVTGVYAFQLMPQTKFVFSYRPSVGRADDDGNEVMEVESNLASLATYVQILRE